MAPTGKNQNKQDIRNLLFDDLVQYLQSVGEKSFRADQVFKWIYKKGVLDFDGMSDLSSSLRDKLKENFVFNNPETVKKQVSKDKTTKFLLELHDGERIETVLIPARGRITLCVSTQAGCKFACKFCASAIGGWVRDLDCSEIITQVQSAEKEIQGQRISHIVFMGTGEPLDNYENVLKAIRVINSSKGMNIAARRITVSTCGLIPEIMKLAKEGIQFELAISLHGADNKTRNKLVPINKKYPIEELMAACREYIKLTKRQITFEYVLIKGVTCTKESADMLGKILKGMLCKMNLIPYNAIEGFSYEPPSKDEAVDFKKQLLKKGIHSTIRKPRGQDVSAACGQLKHTHN